MKEITIGTKKYPISCHAFCYSAYSDIFDRSILEDIKTAQRFIKKQFDISYNLALSNKELKENPKNDEVYQRQSKIINDEVYEQTKEMLPEFFDCITKLCWICLYDANRDIDSYDNWKDTLERLSVNDDWVLEVLALVADCFC